MSTRLERLLYQIDGVEYVYSMSRPNMAIVTVRFYVGESRENSLVKLYNKLSMNTDLVTPGITGWVVKPIEIDDVPIVNVTLWSRQYNDYALRRMAEQVEIALQAVPNTARTEVVGGRRRQIRVQVDPDALAAHRLTPLDVVQVLRGANVNVPAGSFNRDNREWLLESGPYIERRKTWNGWWSGYLPTTPSTSATLPRSTTAPKRPPCTATSASAPEQKTSRRRAVPARSGRTRNTPP